MHVLNWREIPMNKSLQDQLLKAGLVDAKKAKQISKENRKANKAKIRSKDKSPSETQAAIQEAKQQKLERDRELNLKLKQEADKKALAAQVSQLVDHYKLNREDGEAEYNFKVGKKIKKIRVKQRMLEEIIRGRLCIVKRGDVYDVIPKPIADKIRERDDSFIVVYNSDANTNEPLSESDDDYYAQFKIPDDLSW